MALQTNKINIIMNYIDLNLPSGNLWANCNIGATSKEVFGRYLDFNKTQEYAEKNELTVPTIEESSFQP